MKRKKNIQDAFFNNEQVEFFNYPEFTITNIRNITDQSEPVLNDVYIDYSYLSGTTISGTTSIYNYE